MVTVAEPEARVESTTVIVTFKSGPVGAVPGIHRLPPAGEASVTVVPDMDAINLEMSELNTFAPAASFAAPNTVRLIGVLSNSDTVSGVGDNLIPGVAALTVKLYGIDWLLASKTVTTV